MECDVVVVGGGLAGCAAAWALTGRGYSVVLVETYGLHHAHGSSHGTSRIFRRAYTDPFYVRLTGRAQEQWDTLEAEAGLTLRVRTGGIDSGGARDLPKMAEILREQGIQAQLLDPAEVAQRWPGMAFNEPVMFHPDAGYLDPDAAISAFIDVASRRGLTVLERAPALSMQQTPTGVSVSTAHGTVTADRAVVAAGAWLPELLPHLAAASAAVLPALTVKQQEVFHFRRLDPATPWPVLVHKDAVQLYALPSGADGGPEPAMKVAQFDSRCVTTASTRDGCIDPMARATVTEFVASTLPGLEPDPVGESSCLFTMTPDEDFILDRTGDVVIASPCSGHGAKFAPLLGTLVADLVEGATAERRFAFAR